MKATILAFTARAIGTRVAGIGATVMRNRRAALAVIGSAFLAIAVAMALTTSANVPEFAAVKAQWKPSEAYLLDRNGDVLDEQRMDFNVRRFDWAPLDTISPALTAAIIDGEDRKFWTHHGVDWAAMLGAVRDQSVSQRRRGASTISMQVAALLNPQVRAGTSNGAWQRKLAQIRMARALESRWSKAQILETYLNLLGFRGELQGIGAASRMLAGKAPSGLSLPESLVLAALLPAPRASVDRVVSRACSRATARHLAVDCAGIEAAAAAILSGKAIASTAPALAPQLAQALLKQPGERVRTTLDANLQRVAINTLREHLAGLSSRNVRDGAVLIVENDTGNVLAYVGSAGAASRATNVDGVRARRQAGSTLKPFLFELALERRYLTAASLLDDAPITLDTASGIYLPQDYDRDFKGLVSVRTALGSSLNVPAVRALLLVGVEPFRDRLHSLGYAGITQPGGFYGFSLALGSAEVSLWEQVQAYRALARGGQWDPIAVTRGANPQGGILAGATSPSARRFAPNGRAPAELNRSPVTMPSSKATPSPVSAAASFIISDILSDRAARALTFGLDNHLNTPFWSAVKTGTSKDMRDNWCIGFSRLFTVGVWVGNFEGDSMHDVSGVTGAAPVWHDLIEALHARLPSPAPAAPAGVTSTLANFSPAVEPARKELLLTDAGLRTTTTITVASDLARIASPANGMIIAIDPDIPPARQRVPLAARGALEGAVLKLNGSIIGSAQRSVMWQPVRGTYSLALEDTAGRTLDSARFTVR